MFPEISCNFMKRLSDMWVVMGIKISCNLSPNSYKDKMFWEILGKLSDIWK
jgi:hypothetical protein